MGKSKVRVPSGNDNRRFAVVAIVLEIVVIVLFALYVDYPRAAKVRSADHSAATTTKNATSLDESADDITTAALELEETTTAGEEEAKEDEITAEAAGEDVNAYYPMFQDVHTMIFIGFGFLMTFLKQYAYSAVGLNLFLAAFAAQWATLIFGFMNMGADGKIYADMTMLINAEFTAGTVLISFGAVLGTTTPFQLMIMALLEVALAKASEHACVHTFHATDVGGSMYIHAFGAYFGLALAFALQYGKRHHLESDKESPTKTSDVFAMIGTIFLWMFWPSFNGALATDALRQRAIINTYFSLTGAVIACFSVSALVQRRNKFDMVHVQNASLAGGVAIGTCADMLVGPFVSLLIGCFAATVAVLGYHFITPRMNRFIHDTCGVHNLHGMPGVIGALCGVLFAGLGFFDGNPKPYQALAQLYAFFLTMGVAIGGGLLVGLLLRLPLFGKIHNSDDFYDDNAHWMVHIEHGAVNDFVDVTAQDGDAEGELDKM